MSIYLQRFKSEAERFEEKYTVQSNGCWQWKTEREYPEFWNGSRYVKASRYIWQKTHSVILTPEQCVCHHCDNTRCVNPDHMFVGSHTDNMRDKAKKKRTFRPKGRLNGRARVTPKMAAEIRAAHASGAFSQQRLADLFGIAQTSISRIVRGENWNGDANERK